MTQIRINQTEKTVKITLVGHADYDTEKDVVCAGVSTVTYGTANYLYGAQTRGKIKDLEFKDRPGNVMITFTITEFPEWDEIKSMILDSFMTIEESYPNNVNVGGAH